MGRGLEDEHARALPEHEAVAVGSEGATGGGRVVVAPRERSHGGEGRHGHGMQRRVGSAGYDDVGASQRDEIRAVGDGLGPRGAGRHGGVDAASSSELDADGSGGRVGHEGGYRRGRNPTRPMFARGVPGLHDGADRPHSG